MRLRDFRYELPESLIAQRPLPERGASRLLALDGADGCLRDLPFAALPELIRPGDLVVLNDTRVVKARLHGVKASGGRVEVLVERPTSARRFLAQVRASKSPRAGSRLLLGAGDAPAVVRGRDGDLFEIELDQRGPTLDALLAAHGSVPLPPYIRRSPADEDEARYQTVYARVDGAVAAPTAGLHLDRAMIDGLAARGVEFATVTLHVGAGTFQPVRTEHLEDHHMHAERLAVSAEACARIAGARDRGARVIAIGTTVVRALESVSTTGVTTPFDGDTRLFIAPGFRFRCVDAMVTNFHLPESTLLMLVCAFAGAGETLAAYRHAVAARYRFFSYGDAMFITRRTA